MANIDNPHGFRYEYSLGDKSPAVRDFELEDAHEIRVGDLVKFEAGYVKIADTAAPVLGLVLGPAATDDSVLTESPIVGDGVKKVKVLIATSDTVFRVQDANPTPTIANRGEIVDFSGNSGERVITTGVIGTSCFVFDKAGPDNIAGNEYGANMDWLVTFVLRFAT